MTTTSKSIPKALITELRHRWLTGFMQLREGEDWPPGCRMRTEGLMEAVIILSPGAESELTAAMNACHCEVFGSGLSEVYGEDWQEFYPFPQIPVAMARAPVYPSTPD